MATYIVGPCAAAYNVDDFKRIAFQPRFLSQFTTSITLERLHRGLSL